MTGPLAAFVMIDAILVWMLRDAHRKRGVWILDRDPEQNRIVYWIAIGRLAALLTLSLVGTIAAWRAG